MPRVTLPADRPRYRRRGIRARTTSCRRRTPRPRSSSQRSDSSASRRSKSLNALMAGAPVDPNPAQADTHNTALVAYAISTGRSIVVMTRPAITSCRIPGPVVQAENVDRGGTQRIQPVWLAFVPGVRCGQARLRSSEHPEESESQDGVLPSFREVHGIGVSAISHELEIRAHTDGWMQVPFSARDPHRERRLTAQ